MAPQQPQVRTTRTGIVLNLGKAQVALNIRQLGTLLRLLQAAANHLSRVEAHYNNLTRSAKSPWTAADIADRTHDDLERIVAEDQAGSWEEG